MKQIYSMLAITLLIPTITMAGIRGLSMDAAMAPTTEAVPAECSIGLIETSYNVSENKITFNASVYIKSVPGKGVPDTIVSGAWRDKKGIITSAKCTTNKDGKCSMQHVVRIIGKKVNTLPQRGIRIIDVECPNLKYTYTDNTNFAWVTIN